MTGLHLAIALLLVSYLFWYFRVWKKLRHLRRQSTYQMKLQDPRWRAMSARVMRESNWRCALCGNRARDVHHIEYLPLEPRDVEYLIRGLLIPLCNDCHAWEHGRTHHKTGAFIV